MKKSANFILYLIDFLYLCSVKNKVYNFVEFPNAKGIVVSGDIHGDFTDLVNKCCSVYDLHDTLIIVAGDCGFGFSKKGYYDSLYKKCSDHRQGFCHRCCYNAYITIFL